jgi:hypothetical protein
VLGGVLLQQGLEVGRAGGQDHLVGLAGLTVARLQNKIKKKELVYCGRVKAGSFSQNSFNESTILLKVSKFWTLDF